MKNAGLYFEQVLDSKGVNVPLPSKSLLPELYELWYKYSDDEQDYRSGINTYGYEDIEGTLYYISDRWKCAFRIKWLIDLIEGEYKCIKHK